MEVNRPWAEPAGHVLVRRLWKYAPPPWVMYEAIVNDSGQWLPVRDGEPRPRVDASRRPDAVLLKPWMDDAVTAVELQIRQDGHGSAITVLAYGEAAQLPDETRRRVKYGLGVAFGGNLRDWVDEPHR